MGRREGEHGKAFTKRMLELGPAFSVTATTFAGSTGAGSCAPLTAAVVAVTLNGRPKDGDGRGPAFGHDSGKMIGWTYTS